MAAWSDGMRNTTTRLIASEDIAHVARWQFGAVGGNGGMAPEGGISDPKALRDAHALGHAEGFAAGRAEALAEAEAQHAIWRASEGFSTLAPPASTRNITSFKSSSAAG